LVEKLIIAADMSFSRTRFLVFSIIGLPIGFILTALVFAVSERAIVAEKIFPSALILAVISGLLGAFWKQSD
jgi:hypothetical protein